MKEKDGRDTQKLAAELRGLESSTGGLMLECEVSVDVARTESSYDVVLNSLFENLDALQRYQVHPEHVNVLGFIKEACASVVKIDYEA
jgi:hypothetical protein